MRVARKPRTGAPLDVPAPPFDYNPSAWGQRIPICVLAMVAFFIATYMGLYQWDLIDGVWDPFFGESTMNVLDSDVSRGMERWIHFPDSPLGALAYLGDAIFGLAGSTRRWQYRPWLVILFGIDVIPLGIVSGVLVVLQGAIVGAWCFPCLVTAAISFILVVFAYDEVWATLQYLKRVWNHTHDRRVLWDTFWGRRVAAAEEVALADGVEREARRNAARKEAVR